MPEAEVVYSEVQFDSRARGSTNAITSSSDEVTYSEVRILKGEAPAELPVSQQGAAQLKGPAQGGWRRRWRDVALLVLGLLLAAAVSALAASLNKIVQTQDQLQKLQFDLEALKRNLSDLENENTETGDKLQSCTEDLEKIVPGEPCLKCEGGWEQHEGRCYRFSSSSSSWLDSRSSCRDQGGDLVKIDSREEQTFLQDKVRRKQSYIGEKFWIGLTDSDTEGQWTWVDGSPLDPSLSFWGFREPDNWKKEDPDGEDCVRMGERWWDKTCKAEIRWICEKQAEQKGRLHVCKSVQV